MILLRVRMNYTLMNNSSIIRIIPLIVLLNKGE